MPQPPGDATAAEYELSEWTIKLPLTVRTAGSEAPNTVILFGATEDIQCAGDGMNITHKLECGAPP